jgi:hypothetical protein
VRPPQIVLGLAAIEWYKRERERGGEGEGEREKEKILKNTEREMFQCHFVDHKS